MVQVVPFPSAFELAAVFLQPVHPPLMSTHILGNVRSSAFDHSNVMRLPQGKTRNPESFGGMSRAKSVEIG